jgi:radical SAM superfamily enzyme YgiQ (UPF0313 family)
VQIASVRADTFTKNLAVGLHKLGVKSVTMAVESGSEKLREIINKKVSNETIYNSIKTIYDSGINSVKLYGMVGLPNETWDDLNETVNLLKKLKSIPESTTRNFHLSWGCSVFVPKAGTPFQIFGVDKEADKKLKYYKKELHKIGVAFKPESYKWSLIQALISRGDRSVGEILEKAYRYGSSLGSFNKAIKESPVDTNKVVFENWDANEKLPWDNIQGHLSSEAVMGHAKK